MNATTDLPRRLTRRQPRITFAHARWDAPRIKTDDYFRCGSAQSESWSGEQDLSGGLVRCIAMPHYDAIVAEATRAGWPRDYRRDVFVHDRNFLARVSPDVPFVWMLRELGSHLYLATTDRIDSKHYAWDAPGFVDSSFGPHIVRFYTWDGSRLHEHRTKETAAEATRELAYRYGTLLPPCWLPPITMWRWRQDRAGEHVVPDCGG
jgi:hypothetical protein